MEEVEGAGDADIGSRLIEDFLGLDRRHAVVQRRPEHEPIFVHRLAGDDRRELRHQPRADVERAVRENFVEGEVAENLDQFGIGDGELRDMSGKERVVVFARALRSRALDFS